MKLSKLITGFLLLLSGVVCAQSQDSLLRYYRKYPKQAITEAERLYQEAIQKQNATLLIQSLLMKTAYTLEINQDQYPVMIREAEALALREKDTTARCILYSYIGQLYLQYYQQNEYTYNQRTNLEDTIPVDIKAWSGNLFREKIVSCFFASLAPAKVLEQTPVSRYKLILLTAPEADTLRPTLYDFLSHRAINFLTELIVRGHYNENTGSISEALTPFPEFLKLNLRQEIEDIQTDILQIYQNLLNFRKSSNDTAAFVLADLERLEYAYYLSSENPKADSLYAALLNDLSIRYANVPIVIEIWYRQAQFLMQTSDNPQLHIAFFPHQSYHQEVALQQALAICQKGIREYPHYPRINLLKKLIKQLKEPSFNTSYANTVYPGKNVGINISAKNISDFTIEVSRTNKSTVAYEEQVLYKKKAKGTVIFKQNYTLNETLTSRDTSIQIPGLSPGLYQIDISMSKARKPLSGHFVCTSLFTTQQAFNHKKYLFKVRDAMSGKPVKNALVYLYTHSYREPYKLVDSARTNQNGIAVTTSYRTTVYQVVNAENPNGLLCDHILVNQHELSSETKIWMVTDRKIYRPGQTIYFKGILWKATIDSLYLSENRLCKVTLYGPQHEVIKQIKLKTDAFGSFSSSFQLPAQTLNGNYSIEAENNYAYITVAEYKRPEFEVKFDLPDKRYRTGDTICLKGQVSSFSGVPVTDRPVKYEITQYSPYSWFPTRVNSQQGTLTTNDEGKFDLTFKASQPTTTLPLFGFYFYKITASSTDAKGDTQSGNIEVPIFTGKYQPIISIPEQVDKNKSATFYISLKDFPSQETSQKANYTIALLKSPVTPPLETEIRDTIVEKNILRGQLLISGTDSIRPDLKNYPSGAYLLTVCCNGIASRNIFYLYSPSDKTPPIPTYNWLVKEKTTCLPGESARILFGSSLKEVYVSYEIFDFDRLLAQKQLILSNQVISIDIPYRKEYSKQIWLSLNYVKNGKYIQDFVPITRLLENRELTIQTKVFRDKLTPGQQEEWDLRIVNSKGLSADAEVLAMMYDASLDKIQPYSIPVFSPQLISRPFYYSWYSCRKAEENNKTYIYNWIRDTAQYQVPPFAFDRLNTYTFREPVFPYFFEGWPYYNMLGVNDYGIMECKRTSMAITAAAVPMVRSYSLHKSQKLMADVISGRQESQPITTPVQYRQDFRETAFFYPQLKTDSSGNIHLSFTMPEATTRWKFYAMAYTQQLAVGQLERYIVTSKKLMVRPNLPRFFRSGDQAEVKVTVSNLSEDRLQGEAVLELFLPADDSVFIRRTANFNTTAGRSQTLTFHFNVPQDIDLTGCRISASTPSFSDGEQQLIPILPDRILVTQTQPIYTANPGIHTFRLESSSSTKQDYRLTFELTANPIWYAVLALPTLTIPRNESVTDIAASFYANTLSARIAKSNPEIEKAIHIWEVHKDKSTLLSKLEQNAELKSILLEASPWVLEAQSETEKMQALAQLFDSNRLKYLQHTALEKLHDLQTSAGGWSWFKDMPASLFMTCNVLTILARTNTIGQTEYQEQTRKMQIQALRFLDEQIKNDYKNKSERIHYNQLLYLYSRSLYRDIPLGDALNAHKYYLSLIQKQWDHFSLYEKAIAAVTLHRYGIPKVPAEILESLQQYAVNTPEEGMYWPGNRNYYYRNSAVQVEVAILEAFSEIKGNVPEINAMKQWLLQQKQTQTWASVPATVDAIYALVLTGSDLLNKREHPEVTLGKQSLQMPSDNNPLGYLKKTYMTNEITPELYTVKITKQTDTPTWGALYLQYFEKLSEIKPTHSGLGINKQLFLEQTNPAGKKSLIPLNKTSLKIGDKIIVRLTFSLERDMEFLHLKDLRAACFEPIRQVSGNQWKFGSVYYEESKDAATSFFFNALHKGTYVIEYGVYVNQEGVYQDGIATFQSAYSPEFNAFSKANSIKVGD